MLGSTAATTRQLSHPDAALPCFGAPLFSSTGRLLRAKCCRPKGTPRPQSCPHHRPNIVLHRTTIASHHNTSHHFSTTLVPLLYPKVTPAICQRSALPVEVCLEIFDKSSALPPKMTCCPRDQLSAPESIVEICLLACLFVCLLVCLCLCVRLFVCLFVCVCCLFICTTKQSSNDQAERV